MKSARSIGPLTEHDERQRLAEDAVSLSVFVVNNSFKYAGASVSDELIGVGIEAVVRASRKFDFSRGYAWSTYACRSIYNAMVRYLEKTEKSQRFMRKNRHKIIIRRIVATHEFGDVDLEDSILRAKEIIGKEVVDYLAKTSTKEGIRKTASENGRKASSEMVRRKAIASNAKERIKHILITKD